MGSRTGPPKEGTTVKTIHVDVDRDTWLPVPEAWPWGGFATAAEWAAAAAAALADAHGLEDATRDWLASSMVSVEQEREETESRFLYVAEPASVFFFLTVIQGPTIDDLSLADLVAASDEAATHPPEIEAFPSALGTGLTSVRYVDTGEPDHDIAGIVQHAWRVDGLDIVVIGATFDLAQLAELRPSIDAFARTITVVDA